MMKKVYTLVQLALSVLIIGLSMPSNAQFVTSSQTIGSGTNQLDISIKVDSAFNRLRFEITGPATAWFGFSFNSTSMSPGSYTILANVGGNNPAEYVMVQHAAPSLQTTQNLQNITSSTASGRKTFVFYRDNVSGDVSDFVFSHGQNTLDIAWAYGVNLSLAYHDSRGGSSMVFSDPCVAVQPTPLPTLHICQGDSTMIFGEYKKVGANYIKHFPRLLECDSLVSQQLIVYAPSVTSLAAINVCNGDSVMVFGHYQHAAGIYYDTLQSIYLCDSVISQQLIVHAPSVTTLPAITLCNGDSVMVFGNYQHAAGIYYDTLQNIFSCDSLLMQAIQLTITDTTVIQIADSLFATAGADAYQWYDCQTGMQIVGATSNVYVASANGLYKVKVTNGNCSAYSSCYHVIINNLGVSPKTSEWLGLYPNPANEQVYLHFPGEQGFIGIVILDALGKEMQRQKVDSDARKYTLDVSHLKEGLYFLRLSLSDNTTFTRKLLITR
jgi:hypothetical protein